MKLPDYSFRYLIPKRRSRLKLRMTILPICSKFNRLNQARRRKTRKLLDCHSRYSSVKLIPKRRSNLKPTITNLPICSRFNSLNPRQRRKTKTLPDCSRFNSLNLTRSRKTKKLINWYSRYSSVNLA